VITHIEWSLLHSRLYKKNPNFRMSDYPFWIFSIRYVYINWSIVMWGQTTGFAINIAKNSWLNDDVVKTAKIMSMWWFMQHSEWNMVKSAISSLVGHNPLVLDFLETVLFCTPNFWSSISWWDIRFHAVGYEMCYVRPWNFDSL
jgi:hypothetical protein